MISALDLSADAGLVAVVLATLNIGIGLLIWGRYSPWREWPHRRFDIFRLHRWTGYGTLTLTLFHPIPLLFARRPVFRIVDVAFPLWSPQQPLENTIGAAALYLLVIVVVTSLYRIELGRRIWKRFHYLTYAAGAALFIHGILTDPQLNHSRIDPLDGEKVLVESCLLLIAAGTVWRLRHGRKRRAVRERERERSIVAALPEATSSLAAGE
ncbi:MAG TPA: ferric reductase-like transmembrane domain-containing protein [Terriglobia bacterium]|nr:ferric reductase-like transmembrane domain-containing protein [Terriglobia bacterium]